MVQGKIAVTTSKIHEEIENFVLETVVMLLDRNLTGKKKFAEI